MQYPTLPPELNSLRMLSGAGSGPMLQAAQAWQSLGNSLRQASSSFGNVTSNLTNGAWQGAASQAMAQAAAPYIAWLTAAATHSETAALQSQLVALEDTIGEVLGLLENWRGASFAEVNQETAFGEPGKGVPHGNENTGFAAQT